MLTKRKFDHIYKYEIHKQITKIINTKWNWILLEKENQKSKTTVTFWKNPIFVQIWDKRKKFYSSFITVIQRNFKKHFNWCQLNRKSWPSKMDTCRNAPVVWKWTACVPRLCLKRLPSPIYSEKKHVTKRSKEIRVQPKSF